MAFALIGLLWMPWAPSFLAQCQQASRSYPGYPFTWQELAKVCYQTLAVRWEDDPPSALLAWAATAACLLAPAAMFLLGRGGLRLIGLCVLATFDTAISFSITGQNILQSRYFVFANALLLCGLPPLLVLAADANPKSNRIRQAARRRWHVGLASGAALMALVAGMACLCLMHAERRDKFAQRPGMMGAMAYLAKSRVAGELVLVCNPLLQVTAAAHAQAKPSPDANVPRTLGGPQPRPLRHREGGPHVQVLSSDTSFPYYQGAPVMRDGEYLAPDVLAKSAARRLWVIDACDWISPEWRLVLPSQWIEVSAVTFREWPGENCRIIVRCYARHSRNEQQRGNKQ